MAHFKHTDASDTIIRDGYASNRCVADIAADLGLTRNAVIGRARRIGLADKSNHVAAMNRPEVRQERSAIMAAKWSDPEWKASAVAARRIAGMWRRQASAA